MNFLYELLVTSETFDRSSIEKLQSRIDVTWFERALAATRSDVARLRKRRLPAYQVLWLVIGMALYRNRSIADVADTLDIALPEGGRVSAARSALTQARARVGAAPVEWIFESTAREWIEDRSEAKWRGLNVYAMDGSKLAVADTAEIASHFGRHRSGTRKTESAYPLVRIVWLMDVRTRLIRMARFGPYTIGELSYAKQLLPYVPDNALLIVDRLYHNSPMLVPIIQQHSRHFLVKVKKHATWKFVQRHAEGDEIVEVRVTDEARAADASLPRSYQARCLRCTSQGKTYELLTSLLDATQYPADEIRALYHERWEVEIGYDEFKTDLLEHEETLRSRTVEGVYQELWGSLLAYNLVRVEMDEVAREAGVPNNRISFVAVLWRIRNEWQWCAIASPGAIPRHLKNLRNDLKRYVLPPRRQRYNPRHVKRKESPYPRKRSRSQRDLLN